jgi:hypothetical protein
VLLIENENVGWACPTPKTNFINLMVNLYQPVVAPIVGSNANNGSNCSLFYLNANNAASNVNSNIASRLVF